MNAPFVTLSAAAVILSAAKEPKLHGPFNLFVKRALSEAEGSEVRLSFGPFAPLRVTMFQDS
jgi:hypothetical protein